MAPAPPVQTLAAHLINQTLESISLLESLALISAPDAHFIRSKLPNASGPFPNLTTSDSSQQDADKAAPQFVRTPSNAAPSPIRHNQLQQHTPPQNYSPTPSGMGQPLRARALWDYSGTVGRTFPFGFRN
jgi:hypothetical protein